MERVSDPAEAREAAVRLSQQRTVAWWLVRVAVVVIAAFGLAVRIFALGRHAINADQAVVGLMAEQILHGHFSAFYWGQSYGGGEPYVVALVFAVVGQSTFSLDLTPVLLDLVAALLCWRIGRRLFGNRVGVTAALLFWVWPEVYIWQSTIEYGFRWFVLDLGLGAMLLSLRFTDRQQRFPRGEALLLGLCLGAGWWGSPEIMYFVLPIVGSIGYVCWRERRRIDWREVVLAVIGALVGAAVWLEVNLRQHFISLHAGVQPDPGFFPHLKVLVQHAIPLLLGLQLRVLGTWLFGPVAGPIAVALGVIAGVLVLGRLARRREAPILVIFCVIAPFIYGISPFTWYWEDGRYAMFLAPAAALLAAVGAQELVAVAPIARTFPRGRFIASSALVVALGLGLSLGAMAQLAPYHPNGIAQTGSATWTSWTSNPSSGFSRVADRLERDGITDLYAGYWVAYPLMFASEGKIVASDISYVRNPAFLATLEHDRSTAWLFLNPKDYRLGVALTGVSLMDPSCAALSDRCLVPSEFTRYLTRHKIGYRTFGVAPFVAIVPDEPVSPVTISTTFRLRAAYVLPS